ncbi:helix-hairpin-helix domain-containing protein [Corynebacterium uberis]|uniref:ComEA family DNA-binding protein n=1 Tax=Corynebacterium TaxID=1716 RepID=UPI001D0AAE3E|nr:MULTISPECIES: ComEA family DNA-binding protein [Corynebacterium]MCZ9310091.1 ComEA family DNA-binding protein [Corynebacterium sp. c6VSa_13]UDL73837.1 ComEA family DNA-binding protein [Corynebacterium uberis]UDL75279.1 ComEA family DNA-binding protein [Corynebacterium uberis]UDL77490.1 ComEA family DNA-binding protein [Corynebacterium uberis]UDL79777.1 ComEA family DNA-binding protein [Corynebacterium uberis]
MDVVDRLKELTRPTGEEDLMEVTYPPQRWHISARQGIAAGALAVVALGGWWVVARPADDMDATLPAQLAAAQASMPAEPTQEHPNELVVAVIGDVEHPGLVTLAPGARVADALDHARPHPGAQVDTLNLARKLSDGEQLAVPAPGQAVAAPAPAVGSAPGGGAGGMVSLNSASVEELMALDGVGKVTATAIVDYRDKIGGFSDVAQLKEVRGIGPAKFEAISSQVSL